MIVPAWWTVEPGRATSPAGSATSLIGVVRAVGPRSAHTVITSAVAGTGALRGPDLRSSALVVKRMSRIGAGAVDSARLVDS